MMRTANPALNTKTFRNLPQAVAGQAMTIQGAVNKTAILLAILFVCANWVWGQALGVGIMPGFLFGGLFGGLIVAFITIRKKEWAPVTAPIYAALEGLFLGALSAIFERQYPGIVLQAVGLTFGTLGALLAAYTSGLIPVTQNFRLGVTAATGGICLMYLASFVMSFFGASIPLIHSSGPFGIGFSVFVIIIAALNLVLDFDFIKRAAEGNLPKYMDWYAAFGLMVTLIWLYIEILRLLAKLRGRY